MAELIQAVTAENTYSEWKPFRSGKLDLEISGDGAGTVLIQRRCKSILSNAYAAVVTEEFDYNSNPRAFNGGILTCNQANPEYKIGVATGSLTSAGTTGISIRLAETE